MEEVKKRCFRLDGDLVEVDFHFDSSTGKYFGDYPDFETAPRFTSNGKPWVNALFSDCPYADGEFDDCGSCRHFIREKSDDLIGICAYAPKAKQQA